MKRQTITRDELTRTVYMFGSMTHGPYGAMTFGRDGRIGTRYHPNEFAYSLNGEVLAFETADGQVTSKLAFDKDSRTFRPLDGRNHVLTPLLELGPTKAQTRFPPVFVNTVPKSGTYLMYAALQAAGMTPLDLHVMDGFLHDNRGVPPEEIHYDPAAREHPVSADAVAGIMRPGEFVVGHLDSPDVIRRIADQGVQVINLIREPRAMLLSHEAFRRAKVKPTPEDLLWQSEEGIAGFKAFLLGFPIEQWLRQTEMIAERFPFLRFEDILKGKVKKDAVGDALNGPLTKALRQAVGAKTSTFLEGERGPDHPWLEDRALKAFFRERRVNALSRRYWPEMW